jgi:4-hydroxybenzoate polyprenyltransferase
VLKKWLQLFRAQTGFATFYTIVTPFLLAGGDPWKMPIILPISLFFHYAGFGHNSVMDYWYDINDMSKKHHPLITGEISLTKAHQVIHTMLIVGYLIAVALVLLWSPSPTLALTSLLMYIVFGHAYNDGLNRHTIHSWLPISLCFAGLAAYGWFLASSEVDLTFIILVTVTFSVILYQIAFGGNLKDVCADEVNLLKVLKKEIKCEYKSGKVNILYVGPSFRLFRYVVDTILLGYIVFIVQTSVAGTFVLILWTIIQARLMENMYKRLSAGIDRDELLSYFGKIEATEFFKIMSVIIAVCGIALYVALVLAGIFYFVLMNIILWGSIWGPRV